MKQAVWITLLLLLLSCQHSGEPSTAEDQAKIHLNEGEQSWQTGDSAKAESEFRKGLSGTRNPNLKAGALLKLCLLSNNAPGLAAELKASLPNVTDQQIQVNCLLLLSDYYQTRGDTGEWNRTQLQLNKILSDWAFQHLYQDLHPKQKNASRPWGLIEYLLSAIILALCALVFVVYKRSKQQEQTLADAMEKIATLHEMAENHADTKNEFRKLALQHFDIHKKVALLNGMLGTVKDGQEKKIQTLFNQAVYDNKKGFDWDEFEASLNLLKGGKIKGIRQRYPQLSDTEYRILILSFTGLSNKESSIVLNLSTNTINALRSSIRKKLGIPDYGDFESHVLNSQTCSKSKAGQSADSI